MNRELLPASSLWSFGISKWDKAMHNNKTASLISEKYYYGPTGIATIDASNGNNKYNLPAIEGGGS